MPETALGLFPDVGSMYWMPRLLSRPMANYLALTGERIRAHDLVSFGLATHYVPSSELTNLEEALVQATLSVPPSSWQQQQQQQPAKSTVASANAAVNTVLQSFQRPTEATEDSILSNHQDIIERCFDADTVEGIVKNLQEGTTEFEQATLQTLQQMSPTSLKLTLEGLRRGVEECTTLAQDLQMEYRMAKACVTMSIPPNNHRSDFYEGVRSILVDKDRNPQWNPARLEDVTDAHVESFLAPVDDELEFVSSSNNDEEGTTAIGQSTTTSKL